MKSRMMLGCQSVVLLLSVCCMANASAQVTSENNEFLRKSLRKFPAADANGDGVLTMKEGVAFRNRNKATGNAGADKKNKVPITHENVQYGPHDRNFLDLWIAESQTPTPLLVCIHGGGFSGGDKKSFHSSGLVKTMLDEGVSVATINYRLTDGGKNPYPIPMHDSGRAVQFLRYHADKYNLDKNRFAATGGSAGGTITLWLGFHDDLGDSSNEDPVLRESTRLTACAPNSAQPSIHLPTLLEWYGVPSLKEHPGGRPLFGLPSQGELTITEHLDRVSRDASPITHLSKDDAPVFFAAGGYKKISKDMTPNQWVHHPLMGIKLKEAMDRIGVESHVTYQGGPKVDAYKSQADFILRKLKSGS